MNDFEFTLITLRKALNHPHKDDIKEHIRELIKYLENRSETK